VLVVPLEHPGRCVTEEDLYAPRECAPNPPADLEAEQEFEENLQAAVAVWSNEGTGDKGSSPGVGSYRRPTASASKVIYLKSAYPLHRADLGTGPPGSSGKGPGEQWRGAGAMCAFQVYCGKPALRRTP
jgi:hypothetical protein